MFTDFVTTPFLSNRASPLLVSTASGLLLIYEWERRRMTLCMSVGWSNAHSSNASLINLPGWEALAITKAGPLWRGVSIALSDTLTCMAAPSWGWPTATFLRVELRSRGSKKTGGEKESKRYRLIRVINQNRRSPHPWFISSIKIVEVVVVEAARTVTVEIASNGE